MNIFSYNFYLLWVVSIFLYYTIAKHHQWLLLLLMSFVFYAYSITKAPIVLLTVSVSTYAGTLWITEEGNKKDLSKKN